MPNSKDIGASLDEPNIVVHCTLKPTSEEASKAYWMEIHRFKDEVEDPIVDVSVDKENVADSSICVDFPQQTCQFPNVFTSPRDPFSFHRPPTSTDAHTFHPGPSTQIDEKISSVVEWIKNSNPLTTPYTYHSPLRSGFMNTGNACDVNDDLLVHVEVQNDENEDGNEERRVEDYVLANELVLVKETMLPRMAMNKSKQLI
ncbi:Hypothetical predicted protein [Olea europaea subsp. europaea]|uniref:Uncharacterized protein n=1 Tax=Olea europaea subsp. europaea TaxID=158383 RepID=A0A8S0Q7P3_OLEEU|nr:Hypothetical predicted protein [Olea europaea subsp. europaea]